MHAHHIFPILVPSGVRDDFLTYCADVKVPIAVNHRPVHLNSYFREVYDYEEGVFPIAEVIEERRISLPIYPQMPLEHVNIIVERLLSYDCPVPE